MNSPGGKTRLCPSILSADFARLGEQVRAVEQGGAQAIHLDVMDGHFVPNLTLGPAVVKAIDRITALPLDVHLMILQPDLYLEAFREAGADWISVHVEAERHLHRTVSRIRELGAKAGVVLNPATPLASLTEILHEVDFILIMSVNPGFGGQAFIPAALDKVAALRALIETRKLETLIEVDGGVGLENAAELVRAGADILVAGNAVFGKGDPEANTRDLLRRMREAEG
ncbi:MAG TPA: ribulose-phosphate 3-epimerase [Candidatus Polarisedimenticolia bacterium]|nr:ribulose-phosphate 3-epimerase [Candidatus Polarisedimenticolia bacterium]